MLKKKSLMRNEKDRFKVVSIATGKTVGKFRQLNLAKEFARKHSKSFFGDKCEIIDMEESK